MPDKPLRVLILHMRFHPDATGTGLIVTEMATDLAQLGAEVTVVTSMPHYGRKQIPAQYRRRLVHRSEFRGVRVWRTFAYAPPSPSLFHRSINYASYTFMSLFAGAASGRHDVLLAISPPLTVALSGWLIAAANRIPMVFNVQDIWPESIAAVSRFRIRWLIYLTEKLELLSYRLSKSITVISEGMRENLLAKGVPHEKLVVIPNWADLQQIQPVSKENGFRRTHNPDNKMLVMFSGNIGYIAVLDTVLAAARILHEDSRFIFQIIGEGNDKARLMALAREWGLQNLRFLSTQPREVLSEMLGAADISIVTLKKELGATNVPSKVYSIMASARPILASVPADSEIARIVSVAKCGWRVPPESPGDFAQALQEIAEHPSNLKTYGENGRRYVFENNSRESLTREYYRLLSATIGDDPMAEANSI